MSQQEINLFARLLDESEKIVAFTGAGISTDSGIPDFRGPKGVWNTMKPIQFHDFISSESVRRESWKRKFSGELNIDKARPNIGHAALARLYHRGKLHSIITQNVDGLHQLAGVPDSHVVEVHGNATFATCLTCERRYELGALEEFFKEHGFVHDCNECGGILKTATISFGQAMPEVEMRLAEQHSMECDFFLVLGSSLVVYPAAGLPQLAKTHGARLAIINEQDTDLDFLFDIKLQMNIGEVLAEVIAK